MSEAPKYPTSPPVSSELDEKVRNDVDVSDRELEEHMREQGIEIESD